MSPKEHDRLLYEMHAEICSVFSNPKRLEVINLLRGGERTVSDLAQAMEISKANLSQQLAIMRDKGILKIRREGQRVYYRLAYPEMLKAHDFLRALLLKQLEDKGRMAHELRRTGP